MTRTIAAALLLAALPGCSVYREATSTTAFTSSNWREIATDADRERLRGWRKAWNEALAAARAADPRAVAADPELFDPDRALAGPALPAGTYSCRTYKLGKIGSGLSDFAASPAYTCAVVMAENGLPSFRKLEGPQRPHGLLFADSPTRQIFLGTLILGDEASPLRYGLDGTRDMAGYVERIGEKRWRLVLPYPRFESKLDIIELVPA